MEKKDFSAEKCAENLSVCGIDDETKEVNFCRRDQVSSGIEPAGLFACCAGISTDDEIGLSIQLLGLFVGNCGSLNKIPSPREQKYFICTFRTF